ncbi:WecB/TagA/CpsF family glycosyltransferase [[Clostridium] polysaccharolyticum]|jgi:N-acetylglucosaminyldiphosphoundecaprenol N-acetyl-beta-D-mannosaminyltransferase|uniref:Polymer biosynthesis protein, WecB/TagA/CpsF family n=1 Tax=[Clostridium] polysaccharolyticum TaxID=29364 RepID=A0A1I0FYN9_9FIRM|nr:WecB/TagA/CpsF family glycosyltransferase [[Clostridium] polysaccharolyticum]SET63680.1 polymer biosynthesis protein, WecB/TagA/CpsF family [[Clostridium] polysaccharolyticum]
MEAKVNIMGLDVDLISTDSFTRRIGEYLTNDYLNLIFILSTSMVYDAMENETYKETLSRAHMLIPGEEAMLTEFHVDALRETGIVTNYRCMYQMMNGIKNENKTMYLVGVEEGEMKQFIRLCKEFFPGIQILGAYCVTEEINMELVVNEINGANPDILTVFMNSPEQENWIVENCAKINAKLCIGIGGIIKKMLEEYKEAPFVFRKLRLEGVYNTYIRHGIIKLKKLWQNRIFKQKVEHYKNKKGE